ncbi:MAG: hypothetical protein V3T72_03490 [Thermoanaerobaculia bacterium]
MQFRSAASSLIGVFLTLALALPVAAQEPAADLDSFRADLLTFAADLETVPGLKAGQATGLAQAVAALSPEQIAGLAERAPRDADWRALPQVLRNVDQVRAKRQARLAAKVAALKTPRPPGAELEEFRADFLLFVDNLRALAPLARDGRLDDQLANLELQIAAVPSEHLGQLRRMYYRNAARWLYQLRGATVAGDKDFDLIPTIPSLNCDIGCPCDFGCDMDCSCTRICVFGSCTRVCDPICLTAEALCEVGEALCDVGCGIVEGICETLDTAISALNSIIDEINGFLNDVVSFFSDVIDEIIALPGTLGDFFTELGNDLLDLLDQLFTLLQQAISDELNPSNILGLMGLNIDTISDAASLLIDVAEAVPVISIPCPDIGVDIPGFGVVGTPRAEYVCKRGLDWIAEKLFDLVPSDSPSVALKIGAALGYYPIKYFCMCLEAQSALCFVDGQATHRQLVESLLDVELSTRATPISVAALQADAAILDTSVADVQTDVDDVIADVVVVAAELVEADDKVDGLSSAQADQQAEVEAFLSFEVRLDIEENLLTDAFDPVASFQFPEALSGFLEVVSGIVLDTIATTAGAGEDTGAADRWLEQGDNLLAEGAFEKAYDAYREGYREAVKTGAFGAPPPRSPGKRP